MEAALDRRLGPDDFTLFDCTASLHGYWSDVTRTLALPRLHHFRHPYPNMELCPLGTAYRVSDRLCRCGRQARRRSPKAFSRPSGGMQSILHTALTRDRLRGP